MKDEDHKDGEWKTVTPTEADLDLVNESFGRACYCTKKYPDRDAPIHGFNDKIGEDERGVKVRCLYCGLEMYEFPKTQRT